MIDKNPQAMALAYKKCKGKLQKIQELGIHPEIEEESVELLIEQLSEAKAKEVGGKMADFVKGQRWYVENLITASGMELPALFDAEYQDAFADSASEDEMLASLQAFAA